MGHLPPKTCSRHKTDLWEMRSLERLYKRFSKFWRCGVAESKKVTMAGCTACAGLSRKPDVSLGTYWEMRYITV